jgi:acetyltransferase-like isoleucine patch superfamily enzyme
MKEALLILGAGQYGKLVFELADRMNCFSKIDFLDDLNPLAIGTFSELENLASKYSSAVIAVGNPKIRAELYRRAKTAGFLMPRIISDSAYVSPTADVGEGVVIESMATVQTESKIGVCSFISSGAVIRHNATVGAYCHCDCNSVVASTAVVPDCYKVEILTSYK